MEPAMNGRFSIIPFIARNGIHGSNGRGWKIWNNILVGGSLDAYGGNTLIECDHNLFVLIINI